MVQREQPALLRPWFNEVERQKKGRAYSVQLDKAELELLGRLETLVQDKNGGAQKVTALTIKILKDFRSH
ncbi:MAG TPA: hypothetical protein VN982_01850 [Candidatus Dormibacteraeota bacterium]|nr:hypothetical protein [Candidatus Dormibacteraeota bacterium]